MNKLEEIAKIEDPSVAVVELTNRMDDMHIDKITKIWKGTKVDGYYIGLKYAVIRLKRKCVKINLDTAQIVSIWDI
jgi:hypothetical protein